MINIVCYGDSITHGRWFAEGQRWTALLAGKLNEWRPDAYLVYNRGIGGNTTTQGLERSDTDLLPWLPATVLLEFGLNDGNVKDWRKSVRVGVDQFKINLRELAEIIIAGEGQPVFIVNHEPNDKPNMKQGNGRTYPENFHPYNPAIRETANALGAPVIDLPGMIMARGIEQSRYLAKDGVHLTVEGNALYADLVFERLREILA